MKRVGAEIAAEDRWRSVGASYAENIDAAYHQHRITVIDALMPSLDGKRVVDFGCGEGIFIRKMKQSGAAYAIGIDIDQHLLSLAAGSGAHSLVLGSVDALSQIDRADLILAANVAAYFSNDQDVEFYRQAKRILSPGGSLVITHSNELFDMFTLNAFTLSFYKAHFNCDPTPLLTHPAKPARNAFNIRENPLTYPAKLACAGFSVVRTEYMNFHAEPPLLGNHDPDDMQRPRQDTLSFPIEDRWKLNFQCSMFGVCANAD
jgi:2-polyprenyl-3-methyl-5-hydroxy-6-metoxy-1,4-benzoquinol methylase